MTQKVLRKLVRESVTSISDTQLSRDVAEIIEEEYYFLVDSHKEEYTWLRTVRELEAVGDTSQPTKIKIPEEVQDITLLRYRTDTSTDTAREWKTIPFKCPQDFIRESQSLTTSESNVTVYTTDDSVDLHILTDRFPDYYTSFDDEFIYFNAYDSSEEATVQQSRTTIECLVRPTFTQSDTFIPTLPSNLFTLLVERSVTTASTIFNKNTDTRSAFKERTLAAVSTKSANRLNVRRPKPKGRK